MNRLTTLLAVAALFAPLACPKQAHGSFLPGGPLPIAEGVLRVIAADGLYAGAEEATVTEFSTDAAGITRYEVKLGSRTETYEVRAETGRPCSRQAQGRATDETKGRSDFDLLASNRNCREPGPEWQIEIRTQSPEQGLVSTLALTGTPDHFALPAGLE